MAETKQAQAITRLRNRLRGNIAISPRECSHTRKMQNIPNEPQSKPIIFAEPQGYVDPPHSIARRNMETAGVKVAKPRGSSRSSFSVRDRGVFVSDLTLASGIWTKLRVNRVTAPIGRLR